MVHRNSKTEKKFVCNLLSQRFQTSPISLVNGIMMSKCDIYKINCKYGETNISYHLISHSQYVFCIVHCYYQCLWITIFIIIYESAEVLFPLGLFITSCNYLLPTKLIITIYEDQLSKTRISMGKIFKQLIKRK